jgi:hypothetical protein
MVYMRFERGHITVTTGCNDRAAGPQLFRTVARFQIEIYSAAEQPGRNGCHTGINAVTPDERSLQMRS